MQLQQGIFLYCISTETVHKLEICNNNLGKTVFFPQTALVPVYQFVKVIIKIVIKTGFYVLLSDS